MVLCDLEDHRAWLVSALDVMLHVIHTRHYSSPYSIGGNSVELVFADPRGPHKRSVRDAVSENRSKKLYERDTPTDKDYLFKDAIVDIWSQMERLKAKDESIESCPGLALRGTMRDKLHGWEYMSLVHEKNYERKEATIAKSSGGWVDLIQDIDALILFGASFGEVIKPVNNLDRLCQNWRTPPKNKDYLAVGVPTLEQLYFEAGSKMTRKHLTSTHLQWHRGSSLFEQCEDVSLHRCRCDRTQRIYHDRLFKTFGDVAPPGPLEGNGCVIFGQANHVVATIRPAIPRENAIHMLPKVPLCLPKASSPLPTTLETTDQSPALPAVVPPMSARIEVESEHSPVSPKRRCRTSPPDDRYSLEQSSAPKRRAKVFAAGLSNEVNGKNVGSDDHRTVEIALQHQPMKTPEEHHSSIEIAFKA